MLSVGLVEESFSLILDFSAVFWPQRFLSFPYTALSNLEFLRLANISFCHLVQPCEFLSRISSSLPALHEIQLSGHSSVRTRPRIP